MLLSPLGLAIYVTLCLALGYLGSNKKFGFVGNFFASILFTPVVGLIMLLAQNEK